MGLGKLNPGCGKAICCDCPCNRDPMDYNRRCLARVIWEFEVVTDNPVQATPTVPILIDGFGTFDGGAYVTNSLDGFVGTYVLEAVRGCVNEEIITDIPLAGIWVGADGNESNSTSLLKMNRRYFEVSAYYESDRKTCSPLSFGGFGCSTGSASAIFVTPASLNADTTNAGYLDDLEDCDPDEMSINIQITYSQGYYGQSWCGCPAPASDGLLTRNGPLVRITRRLEWKVSL